MHKSVIGLIGIGVVIILMSVIMAGLKSSATDSRQDSFSVTTTGGETTAIVGTQELPWKALTSSVSSITSNYASDYPLCEQVSGNEITIEGLAPSETRVVTITYLYDANQGFMGASSMLDIVPLLLWVGIIVVIIGISVAIFQSRRG
jgi:hypothetical protein